MRKYIRLKASTFHSSNLIKKLLEKKHLHFPFMKQSLNDYEVQRF